MRFVSAAPAVTRPPLTNLALDVVFLLQLRRIVSALFLRALLSSAELV